VSCMYLCYVFLFFFQAEDGIRDPLVTGVQTCALPILGLGDAGPHEHRPLRLRDRPADARQTVAQRVAPRLVDLVDDLRIVGRLEIGRASCRERVWRYGSAGEVT